MLIWELAKRVGANWVTGQALGFDSGLAVAC